MKILKGQHPMLRKRCMLLPHPFAFFTFVLSIRSSPECDICRRTDSGWIRSNQEVRPPLFQPFSVPKIEETVGFRHCGCIVRVSFCLCLTVDYRIQNSCEPLSCFA